MKLFKSNNSDQVRERLKSKGIDATAHFIFTKTDELYNTEHLGNIKITAMKYLFFSILLIGLQVFWNDTECQAQTTYSADVIAFNSADNTELSFVFLTKGSQETIQNTTVEELNENLIQLLSDTENVDTTSTTSKAIVVSPSTGSYLGGGNSDDYFVNIRGGNLGNGWDITSVTLNGVEVSNILIQSSNEVVVIPAAGNPGTGDVVITSTSKGKTTIKNGFTYALKSSTDQAFNHK